MKPEKSVGIERGREAGKSVPDRTMCVGPIHGKNRENFGESEEGSGACGERKAGEASEVQTTKGRLPWLLPSSASPPSCGCFALHGSIPPTILRRRQDWGGTLRVLFKKLLGTQGLGACSGVGGDAGLQHRLRRSFCAHHKYLVAPRLQPRLWPSVGLCSPGALKRPQVEELVPTAQGGLHCCVSGDLKKLTIPCTFPPPPQPLLPTRVAQRPPV